MFQLSVLLYWTLGPLPTLKSQLIAAVLVFVNAHLLLFVSYAEHTRAVEPSTFIVVYDLFTMMFDFVIAMTSWLLDDKGIPARLYTSAVVIKLFILAVESWEKRSILLSRYKQISPEATSSIISRSVFWWLNPLMTTGFRRFLTNQDL